MTTKVSKAKSTKGISKITEFTQENIPEFLAQVNEKIKLLTNGKEELTTITVELPGFGLIKDIDDVSELIKALSSVDGRKEAYDKAAEKHIKGIKIPEFKLEGHSHKEWIDQISSQVLKVAHKKELEKLKEIKTTLEANLSQEAKLANDLKRIASILSE